MSVAQQDTRGRSASVSTVNAAISRRHSVDDLRDEKKSIEQEKQAVQSKVDDVPSEPVHPDHGKHPDGGLRAWLAISGVRCFPCPTTRDLDINVNPCSAQWALVLRLV